MKKIVAMVLGMLVLGTGAETVTSRWLGTGGDNKWTNADNWNNGVPGACKYSNVTNDGLAITAEFGPVTAGAVTTIDLSNVLAVSNMVIKAGAPAYVFGTSSTQAYYTHSNGGITIEEGVTTDQTFRRLFPAKWGPADGIVEANGNNNTTRSHYYHHGSGEFVVNSFINSYNHGTYLHGSGTFVLTNNVTSSGAFLYEYCTGKLVVGDTTSAGTFKSFDNCATTPAGLHTIEILDGRTFCVRDWATGLKVLNASCDLLYTGGGTFYFRNSNTTVTPDTHNYQFYVKSGCTATFDVDIHAGSYYDKPSPPFMSDTLPLYLRHTGEGTVVWKKKFRVAAGYGNHGCYYTFTSKSGGTLRLSKMGNLGQGTLDGYNFGELEPVFNTSGTIEWTGNGDSVNRAIGFTAAVTGALKNSGTGTLVYTGTVTQNVDGCVLELNANTAPVEFRGTKGTAGKKLKLSVAGAQPVTVADLGLFSDLKINGRLVVEDVSCELRDMTVSTHSKNSRVELPENCNLVIKGASMGVSSATIDFIVPETSSLTFYGHAAGDIVAWCKVNGAQCYSDADGKLHSYRKDWKTAVSGQWSDGAKWSNGSAPINKSGVYITATGDDYTVTATGPLGVMPSSVTVGTGDDDHTATLAVAGTVGFTNCYFSVTQGGELLLDGSANGGSSIILYGADYHTKAVDGGRVTVTNGGDFRISSSFDCRRAGHFRGLRHAPERSERFA